jgi:hypothetical protein
LKRVTSRRRSFIVGQVIRSILASAGLIVLLPTGVFAQGPDEAATSQAQMAVPKSSRSAKDIPGGISLYGGNSYLGEGVRLTVRDVTNGSSGVSAEFRPKFVVGARVEAYGDGLLGLAFDGSFTSVESPVTTTNGSAVQRRTITYMDSALSILAVVRGKWRVVKPYGGLGPSMLIVHANEQGGLKLSAGMLFMAGTQLWVSRKAFGFAEGRYHLLADRHYSFDSFGIQDAPFPTTTVTVSGSYWSFVVGAGYGW